MLKKWMVKIYIVLMFLVAFAAGKVSMVEAAEGDVVIKVELKEKDQWVTITDPGASAVKGLSYDAKNNVLTMNNYNGGMLNIQSSQSWVQKKLEIKILGNNSICRLQDYMRKMIYIQDLEVNFTGNGKLSLEWNQAHPENNVELVRGGISVNGPTLEFTKFKGALNIKGYFILNSGKVSVGVEPVFKSEGTENTIKYTSALKVTKKLEFNGGTFDVNYIYKSEYDEFKIAANTSVYAIDYLGKDYIKFGNTKINVNIPGKLKNYIEKYRENILTFEVATEKGWTKDLSKIKGLKFDSKNYVLTFDGYNGGPIRITSDPYEVVIDVVVKGENTISDPNHLVDSVKKGIIDSVGASLRFTGGGTLNIKYLDEESKAIAVYMFSRLALNAEDYIYPTMIVDGAIINVIGNFGSWPLILQNFSMKSGILRWEGSTEEYSFAFMHILGERVEVTGGTIIVNTARKNLNFTAEYQDVGVIELEARVNQDLYQSYKFEDCVIILVGDENVVKNMPFINYVDIYREKIPQAPKIVLDESKFLYRVNSLSKVKVDMTKYKTSLSESVLIYDGKEKKPKVKIGGLVEGVDFTVEYQNNVNPGVATVIATGKGIYTGTVKLTFTIEISKVPNGPSENAVISNKYDNYIYKIIKPGIIGGNTYGEVSVIGIRKKKVKKIKIANTVVIDGVKYKIVQIGAKAFRKNKYIKSVVIGKNVREIKKQAFYNCKNLKSVKISSKKLKKIGKKAFYRKRGKKITFKVPKKKKKKYKKLLKKAKTNKYKIK